MTRAVAAVGRGIERRSTGSDSYEFDGHKARAVSRPRVPSLEPCRSPASSTRWPDACVELSPAELVKREVPTGRALEANRARDASGSRRRMVALQEELDWLCYRLYGLIEQRDADAGMTSHAATAGLELGERAFEIVDGPADGGRRAADGLVRAARLDADHRDPRALARGVPDARRSGGSS